MKRNITQLIPRRVKVGVVEVDDIIARCDDGTLWKLEDETNNWVQLPDVPQPKPDPRQP